MDLMREGWGFWWGLMDDMDKIYYFCEVDIGLIEI
jgi:hypothetical protein